MKQEPVLTVATIIALATAILGVLVAFTVPISDDQRTAVLALVAVMAPFLVGLAVRPQVTPKAQVVEVATSTGQVLAGEANELPTGEHVRALGSQIPGFARPQRSVQDQEASLDHTVHGGEGVAR